MISCYCYLISVVVHFDQTRWMRIAASFISHLLPRYLAWCFPIPTWTPVGTALGSTSSYIFILGSRCLPVWWKSIFNPDFFCHWLTWNNFKEERDCHLFTSVIFKYFHSHSLREILKKMCHFAHFQVDILSSV